MEKTEEMITKKLEEKASVINEQNKEKEIKNNEKNINKDYIENKNNETKVNNAYDENGKKGSEKKSDSKRIEKTKKVVEETTQPENDGNEFDYEYDETDM